MRVGAAKARDHHFAAGLLAIPLAQEEQVWRVEHPHAAVANRHARRNVQSLGENRHFVGATIPFSVFENLHSIAAYTGRLAWVLNTLGDPNPATVIERHRDGVHDVGFACDEFDFETLWHRKPVERFGG